MNKTRSSLIIILFLTIFILVSGLVSAATIYPEINTQTVSVGDTIIVNVLLNPLDKKPNVVEGNILIKEGMDKIEISEFSLANSVLNYWPRNPSFDNKSKISFTGGVPGGFGEKAGLLFKIIFQAKSEGKVIFTPSDIKAYNNDNQASLVPVSVNSLTINIGPKNGGLSKNQWLDIISNDSKSPKDLSAIIGQDDMIFDGKKFLAISAIDDQSGIDHYEVIEGNGLPVRSGSNYVLQDQTESSPIIVTAFDKAGNSSKITINPKSKISYIKTIIYSIVLGILLFCLFKLFKKYKKSKLDKNGI